MNFCHFTPFHNFSLDIAIFSQYYLVMSETAQKDVTKSPPPRTGRTGPKMIPIETIAYYVKEKKLTDQEIADILHCDRSNITRRRNDAGLYIERVERFKANRADIFAAKQNELLNELTPAKLKKIHPRDAVVSAGILYDKERLERGQSTEIVNVHALHASLSDLERLEADLQAQLRSDPQDIVIPQDVVCIDNDTVTKRGRGRPKKHALLQR